MFVVAVLAVESRKHSLERQGLEDRAASFSSFSHFLSALFADFTASALHYLQSNTRCAVGLFDLALE